jgi:chromosome segregation ATPase
MEVASLEAKQKTTSEEIASTLPRLQQLEDTKTRLETEVRFLAEKTKRLQPIVDERESACAGLLEKTRALQDRKVKSSSEVDGKEASLARLNTIGFRDEDLLRLRTILERMAADADVSENEARDRFFAAVGTFKEITELRRSQDAETARLKELTETQSTLIGEITALEKHRDVLRGEVSEAAASTVKQIADAGDAAVAQLHQKAENVKEQLDDLLTDAMRAAKAVGEMKAMGQKGEDAGKSLSQFIEEVKGKPGRT